MKTEDDGTEKAFIDGKYDPNIFLTYQKYIEHISIYEYKYEVKVLSKHKITSEGITVGETQGEILLPTQEESDLIRNNVFEYQREHVEKLEESTDVQSYIDDPYNENYAPYWALKGGLPFKNEKSYQSTIIYICYYYDNWVESLRKIRFKENKEESATSSNVKDVTQLYNKFFREVDQKYSEWVQRQTFELKTDEIILKYKLLSTKASQRPKSEKKKYTSNPIADQIEARDKLLVCHIHYNLSKFKNSDQAAKFIEKRNNWKPLERHFKPREGYEPIKNSMAEVVIFYLATEK